MEENNLEKYIEDLKNNLSSTVDIVSKIVSFRLGETTENTKTENSDRQKPKISYPDLPLTICSKGVPVAEIEDLRFDFEFEPKVSAFHMNIVLTGKYLPGNITMLLNYNLYDEKDNVIYKNQLLALKVGIDGDVFSYRTTCKQFVYPNQKYRIEIYGV